RLILRKRVDPSHHELITVRRRLGDARDAGHPARAADILDDHLLAQQVREASAENSRYRIRSAAGREWHHQSQRPCGPLLGRNRRCPRERCERDSPSDKLQKSLAARFHGWLPCVPRTSAQSLNDGPAADVRCPPT